MVPESTTGLSEEDFSFEKFDIDFEFDAPRFYDFSRPELDSETEEIEIWFKSAGNYPPSPFNPKFNWKFEPIKQITTTTSESKPVEASNQVVIESLDTGLNHKDKYNGFIYYNQNVKEVTKKKPKSTTKPSNSTLTRPTASLLARQNKPLDIYSRQLLTRCQRSLGKFGEKLSPLLVSNQDTKKQNLEAKVGHVSRRSKLTVPKEPNLRTAERSERHRSKVVNSEAKQNEKSTTCNSSKTRTTNKNVLSNTPRSQDLQAFRLRTALRAKERSSNAKIDATTNSRTIKPMDSSKSRIVKGNHSTKISCQVYESNICPLDSKTSNKEELSIKYGNQSFCRTDMKPFVDINRSLDLCRKFDSQEVAGNLIIA